MRALIQRVTQASVRIDGEVVGQIGPGLLILLGVCHGDSRAEADWLVDKCLNLRIFSDADGKFNHSLLDTGGAVLVISQFTLYGDCRKGRRPGFTDAADPAVAAPLYEYFAQRCAATGVSTATGRFGADMQVSLLNDGPVTLIVDRDA